jgi:hypothetical protein
MVITVAVFCLRYVQKVIQIVEYQEWFPGMPGVFCVTFVLRQKK